MLSDKAVQKFKDIYKKEYKKDLTDAEARDEAERLVGFFDVLMQVAEKDYRRKLKLKDSPKGFPIDDDGTYSCFICYESITTVNGWYDKYGLKCLNCQRAVEKKIIPPIVFKDRKSWITNWELKDKFGIHPSTARKLIKEGKLKARVINKENGSTHYSIYLLSENQDFLKNYNS